MARSKSESKFGFYMAIGILLVVAVVFLALYAFDLGSYSSLKSSYNTLQSNYNLEKSNFSILQANYNNLLTKYDNLNARFLNLSKIYNATEYNLTHPYTSQIYSNKQVFLYSLLFPYYSSMQYNVSDVGFFTPTMTYLYYDPYYGTYSPLPLINSSYSSYGFNITENESGYLIFNYTSNSTNGIDLIRTDCLFNLFTMHQVTIDTVGSSNSNGTIIIPVSKGKNCFVVSNPSNNEITLTFSAKFVAYPS